VEALSGLDSSERVSDLANVIGKHLSRFLDAPSSSDLGVSIWHTLAWLAGAWSTAIAAPAQAPPTSCAAAEEVGGADVISAAQIYSTKLTKASKDRRSPLEKSLRAPDADALGGAAGVLLSALDVLAVRRNAGRDWLGEKGEVFAMGDLLEGPLCEASLKTPTTVARLASFVREKGFAPVLDALHAAFEATLLADAVRVAGLLRAKEAGMGPYFLRRLFAAGALSLAPREGAGGPPSSSGGPLLTPFHTSRLPAHEACLLAERYGRQGLAAADLVMSVGDPALQRSLLFDSAQGALVATCSRGKPLPEQTALDVRAHHCARAARLNWRRHCRLRRARQRGARLRQPTGADRGGARVRAVHGHWRVILPRGVDPRAAHHAIRLRRARGGKGRAYPACLQSTQVPF
jgi:hypothetical protein